MPRRPPRNTPAGWPSAAAHGRAAAGLPHRLDPVQHWCLQELGRKTDNAAIVSAAGLRIAETTAAYIDRVSEELVAAYEAEKENWLRNLGAARAARVRALLRGDRVDVDASEAVLGYHLRQHHVGAVCWLGDREAGGPALARLEHATMEVAAHAGCEGRPIFVPQDESSAWAWLPLGASDSLHRPTMRWRGGRARDPVRLRRRRRPVSRASAAPTNRRWAPTRSRWPQVRRDRA